MKNKRLTAEQIRFIGQHAEPRFYFENEGHLDFTEKDLEAGFVGDLPYNGARSVLVRDCVDGLISYLNEEENRGILLVTRQGNPAKGHLWPIGGGISREQVNLRHAFSKNAQRECNLKLSDFVYLGGGSFGWATTPFPVEKIGYGGKGIRDDGHIYYAQGHGELKFKELDNNPLIVTPDMWRNKTDDRLNKLHPYVSENLEKAITLIE